MAHSETDDKLSAALGLAGHGYRIFPLGTGRKTPAPDISRDFPTRASDNPDTLRAWWLDPNTGFDQDWNVGVLTGNGLLVLDTDQKPGKRGADSLDALQMLYGDLPVTVEALTPTGGNHRYYRLPAGVPDVPNSASKIGDDLDIRCHHGYVVAPGSTTADGRYQWAIGRAPGEIDIAPAPAWLIELCGKVRERDESSAPLTDLDSPDDIARATEWLDTHAPLAVEGNGGDSTTYKVASRIKDFGVSEATAFDLLLTHWNGRCSPPWEPDELLKKVENAFAYGTSPPGKASALVEFEALDIDEGTPPPPPPKSRKTTILRASDFTGDPPAMQWAAQDWIPAGTVTSLYGDGGVGKSLAAMQLQYASATQTPWLGVETKRMRSLGVYCEDDKDELHRRHQKILQHIAAEEFESSTALDDVLIWPRVGFDNLLVTFDQNNKPTKTAFFDRVIDVVIAQRIDLLILDTAADLFGGNENIRTQVNFFIKSVCGEIIQRAKASGVTLTILLLAHPSQAGMATGYGSSGSTGWNNAVRARLYLTRPEDGGPNDRVLSRKKSNYAAAGDDVMIRLAWENGCLVPLDVAPGREGWPPESDCLALVEGIRGAWESGTPLSMHTQARKGGRYAPRVLAQKTGVDIKRVETTLLDWLDRGLLTVEERDAKRHINGLKVKDAALSDFAFFANGEEGEARGEAGEAVSPGEA